MRTSPGLFGKVRGGLFKLAHPCVKHAIGDAQPLGHVNDRMSFVDQLLDRLVLELDGVFVFCICFSPFQFLTSLFVY
jgi:hypothetical protein